MKSEYLAAYIIADPDNAPCIDEQNSVDQMDDEPDRFKAESQGIGAKATEANDHEIGIV